MDCVYKNQCQKDWNGYPLAMAYVPWQQWKTPYPPGKGLNRGTIFGDLDLPFEKERCKNG